MKTGIVICTHRNSSRVLDKPFRKVGGVTILEHLITNLMPSGLPIILAVPECDYDRYVKLTLNFPSDKIFVVTGFEKCPLKRMAKAAKIHKLDTVIRVTHDKVFVDPETIHEALSKFDYLTDYLYSSHLPDGCGFEIIRQSVLSEAALKHRFKDVEHISYAIKPISKSRSLNFKPKSLEPCSFRFLLDYPQDFVFLTALFQLAGNKMPGMREAIRLAEENPYLDNINKLPDVTIYSCVHNEADYIDNCIASMAAQTGLNFEYIIVDDASTDSTLSKILCSESYAEIRLIRNEVNIGLASSSNLALEAARGKYIIRLDADDCFVFPDSIRCLYEFLKKEDAELVYPDHMDEHTGMITRGFTNHHVGGALFKTSAVQYLKFTDYLRGYDGLDLFERARKTLRIKYYNRVTFFYTARSNSMSKTNLEERAKIKEKIDNGLTGEDLI